MRHAFPPEPRKAELPSQVAGFLPGSLETLSNPRLPGQAAAQLDLPPTSRSCESHSRDPIHPCWGRTRVGEHPATPGTGRPAQGPGAQGRRPPTPTCLPSCPRGGGRPSTGWPGSKKQSGRKPRKGGALEARPWPGSLHKHCWRLCYSAWAIPVLSAWAIHSTEERTSRDGLGTEQSGVGGGPGKSERLWESHDGAGRVGCLPIGGLRLHSPPPGLGKGHPQGTRGDGRLGGRLP